MNAETETIQRDERLLPPLHYDSIDLPRSCNTCGLLVVGDPVHYCRRPGGPTYEAGSLDEMFFVCGRWRKIS